MSREHVVRTLNAGFDRDKLEVECYRERGAYVVAVRNVPQQARKVIVRAKSWAGALTQAQQLVG